MKVVWVDVGKNKYIQKDLKIKWKHFFHVQIYFSSVFVVFDFLKIYNTLFARCFSVTVSNYRSIQTATLLCFFIKEIFVDEEAVQFALIILFRKCSRRRISTLEINRGEWHVYERVENWNFFKVVDDVQRYTLGIN